MVQGHPQTIRRASHSRSRFTPAHPTAGTYHSSVSCIPGPRNICLSCLGQSGVFASTISHAAEEAIVVEAMSTPSCTPSVSEYQCSTARLLWDLKEHTLGSQQKKYLERAGGGHGVSQGWIHRYTDLETFFSDLAICSLKQRFLENVHDRIN
ncbi:hypothetical protein CYMTET_24342 [Cymbomonas tetramitiformis]|uniref:Uncharacterized protein n=1 Tax=Cymbomonas tetramitiformis TaxID=36881 RepID=A0AAE0FWX8_9CHLO|nr:hypothetical protein CYMTET_24342 [Cymbomonas tetramitiformis]